MKQESVIIQKEMADASRSKADCYADLIVGRRGLWPLVKFELITMICIGAPGALGLWLRSRLYPLLLGACGANVNFGRNVVLRHPHKIRIGSDVVVDDNCMLDAKGSDNDGIRIGSGVFIGRNTILSCKNGDIVLGDKVNMGFNSEIFSGSRVVLGDRALVAAYCYFIGGGYDSSDPDAATTDRDRVSYGIEVGEDTWFGAGVKVLDGRSIGRGCIIGAGAVVNCDIPEYAVAVGVPAKVVKNRRPGAPDPETSE
jgi:acetyltransferase-like isoleucine patch superfamily enzyme|tara:strand:- start:455 stop:1219 length:765 start_codon:yes stop_codon:yes gene_type:complete